MATVLTLELEAPIPETSLRARMDRAKHWRTRKLGGHLEVSYMMAARVWSKRKYGLKAHWIELCTASNDQSR